MSLLGKSEFTQRLANNIKEIRESKGISQEELADKAELYRTYINHIETARYSPGSHVVYKIARALDTTVNALYPK